MPLCQCFGENGDGTCGACLVLDDFAIVERGAAVNASSVSECTARTSSHRDTIWYLSANSALQLKPRASHAVLLSS